MTERRTYGWRICSLVEAEGEAIVRGRKWQWEFGPWIGPVFLNRRGDPLSVQPAENHPVWAAFEKWHALSRRTGGQ